MAETNVLGHDPVFEEKFRKLTAITGSKALAKSCQDHFHYALRLRTGEVIAFTDAELISNEWVHLALEKPEDQPEANRLEYVYGRGVDVRISDIVWVMDAPCGS